MTQENKEILLKDLCARLPYGVLCKTGDKVLQLKDVYIDGAVGNEGQLRLSNNKYGGIYQSIDKIKPYLRPMSSMTEVEKETYQMFFNEDGLLNTSLDTYLDWLLEGQFDFRGLIPRGLALEAPEDMYSI